MSPYSIASYGRMLADSVRVDAFAAALEQLVERDSVVLDLGTGTGFLAVLAAQLGAAKVYGIESSDVIELARETARVNEVSDRVEFLFGDSRELDLPERADILVCDIHGVLPWALQSTSTLVDARQRLLKPGAVTIPRRDVLRVAVVEDAEAYHQRLDVWRSRPHGIDIEPGRRFVVNKWDRHVFAREQVLSDVGRGAALEYDRTEDLGMQCELELGVTRDGVGHGLAAWFDCELADGIGFSSGPGGATIYKQVFFYWDEPLEMAVGDRVQVGLRADFVNGEFIWSWNTRVTARDESVRAEYRQSNFLESFPSTEHRRRRAETFRPELSARGSTLLKVLEAMQDGRPLGEIAAALAAQDPVRFPTENDALAWVGKLSVRYSL